MGIKYVKPVARNLGDIPYAQGYCIGTGSTANDGSMGNCTPGGLAIGSFCGFGGTPDPTPALACDTGLIPNFSGCNEGYQNTSSCSFGTNPT